MEDAPRGVAGNQSRSGAWLYAYGPTLWAAVVLLAALYFFMLANEIPYAARPGRLGPAFWPKAILVLLIVTAALDCFVEARKARSRAAQFAAGAIASGGQRRVWWLMVFGLFLILAYINLTVVLGFTLANFLFMIAFMALGGMRKPVPLVLISALGTLILVTLFIKIVYVSLPIGAAPFDSFTLLIYSLLGIA